MTFEVGKTYRTKGGWEAKVKEILSSGSLLVIHDNGLCGVAYHYDDGTINAKDLASYDLVAEDTPSIVTEPDYETRLRDEVTLRFIKIMPTLHPKPYIHHEEFARRVHGFTDAFMAERKKRMAENGK